MRITSGRWVNAHQQIVLRSAFDRHEAGCASPSSRMAGGIELSSTMTIQQSNPTMRASDLARRRF